MGLALPRLPDEQHHRRFLAAGRGRDRGRAGREGGYQTRPVNRCHIRGGRGELEGDTGDLRARRIERGRDDRGSVANAERGRKGREIHLRDAAPSGARETEAAGCGDLGTAAGAGRDQRDGGRQEKESGSLGTHEDNPPLDVG